MTEPLTEERLAEIERLAQEYRIVGVSVADVLALVTEIRRLRAERERLLDRM